MTNNWIWKAHGSIIYKKSMLKQVAAMATAVGVAAAAAAAAGAAVTVAAAQQRPSAAAIHLNMEFGEI